VQRHFHYFLWWRFLWRRLLHNLPDYNRGFFYLGSRLIGLGSSSSSCHG